LQARWNRSPIRYVSQEKDSLIADTSGHALIVPLITVSIRLKGRVSLLGRYSRLRRRHRACR
jgi:hypothetical protein